MSGLELFNDNVYDRDYFENGLCTGTSCYSNYMWMPELTIKMAYNLIRYLDIQDFDRVLDYGCAKGFVVKALKILDIDAYGCDISNYAINSLLSAGVPNIRKMFHVIPLGDNGKFRVPEYHLDSSHILVRDEEWWAKKFESFGWHVSKFEYSVRGVKENWTRKYPKGNGFFTVIRKQAPLTGS